MKGFSFLVLCTLMHVAHTFVVVPKISLKARRSSCVLTTTSALNMNIDTLNMKIEPPRQDIDLLRRKVGHAVAIAVATSLIALASTPIQTLAESLPPGTNPFNSICLGFGCGEFQGLDYGGAPTPTDEESIPFKAFLESLDKGLVAKVDFENGGNKAYVFLKPEGGEGEPKRIRVGEGYPDEQSKGWSSPLWVVRALRDRKVPYTLGYDLGKVETTKSLAK